MNSTSCCALTGLSSSRCTAAFGRALGEAGYRSGGAPKNWPDAFARLKELLQSDSVYREPSSGKRVVFIDELPWIAGKRGSFLKALDEFWNKWGESQEDLLLIILRFGYLLDYQEHHQGYWWLP